MKQRVTVSGSRERPALFKPQMVQQKNKMTEIKFINTDGKTIVVKCPINNWSDWIRGQYNNVEKVISIQKHKSK